MLLVKHKVIDGKEFVKAKATGDFDRESSTAALRLVLEDPKFSELRDVLIDLREAECELTVADVFEIVQFMARHRRFLLCRFAVLVSRESEFDKAEFMELCAENRGLKVHAFFELSEAEEWLGVQE